MKKKIIILLTVGLINTIAFAQDTMYVYQKTGGLLKLPVNNVDSVTFKVSTNTITDIDNNIYPTIIIGNQVWMAENLRVTHFNDGAVISLVTDSVSWSNNYNKNTQLSMMCWYNNDQTTYINNKYGALYNWYTVNTGKLCPLGWHVPNDTEWTTLANYLGTNTAGNQMKSTSDWYLSGNGTNSSKFNGFPGGCRTYNNIFFTISNYGYWWSSSSIGQNWATYRTLNYNDSLVGRSTGGGKVSGFSVRCIKD